MLNWLQFSTTSWIQDFCNVPWQLLHQKVEFVSILLKLDCWPWDLLWSIEQVEAICASSEPRPQADLYISALKPGTPPTNKLRLFFWMTRHESQAPLVTPTTPSHPAEAELSNWPAADQTWVSLAEIKRFAYMSPAQPVLLTHRITTVSFGEVWYTEIC